MVLFSLVHSCNVHSCSLFGLQYSDMERQSDAHDEAKKQSEDETRTVGNRGRARTRLNSIVNFMVVQ